MELLILNTEQSRNNGFDMNWPTAGEWRVSERAQSCIPDGG